MKLSNVLVTLLFTSTASFAAEVSPVQTLAIPEALSLELIETLKASDYVPELSSTAQSWSIRSLSCIAANYADETTGEKLELLECTLENTEGLELKLPADLAKDLTAFLVTSEVAPLAGSNESLQFYSLSHLTCASIDDASNPAQASTSNLCQIENKPSLFANR